MKILTQFIPEEIVEALGWTFFHSIWQFALIAVLLGLVLSVLGKFSSQFRYFLVSSSYVFLLTVAIYTFVDNCHKQEIALPSENTTVEKAKVPFSAEPLIHSESLLNTVSEEETIFASLVADIKTFFSQYFPILVMVWILGVFLLALRFLGNFVYVHRLKNYRVIQPESQWQQRMLELKTKIGIEKQVEIMQSALAKAPMVIGAFKPLILLPLSTFSGISAREMECIIAHELAHIKRHDYLLNLLQKIIEILFFYHPAIWWISSMIKSERENCCDDIAISVTGDSVNLVKALAAIEEKRQNEELAVAFSGNNKLIKRIKRLLLNQRTMKSNFMEGFIASCVIFLGLIAMAFTISSEPKNTLNTQPNVATKIDIPVDDTNSYNVLQSLETPDTSSYKASNELQKEKKVIVKKREIANQEQETKEYRYEYEIKRKKKLDEEYQMDRSEQEEAEIELEVMVKEALEAANAALAEIDVDVDINAALEEAEEGLNDAEIEKSIQESIHAANESLQDLDINAIINEALEAARESTEDFDIEEIINEITIEIEDAMQDIDIKMKSYSNHHMHQHQQRLESGVNTWNEWREKNPDETPQLMAAQLSEKNLTGVNFEHANLIGANLKEAILIDANLSYAQMQGANLIEAKLDGTLLRGADLTGVNMKEADLSGKDLRDLVLIGANLKEALLKKADLRGADLRGADLGEADLTNADLRNADLRGADLSEANLTKANLTGVRVNKNTIFPPGYDYRNEGVEFY